MRSALLTLSVFKTTGGPAKSIQSFQQALDAEVISWGPTRAGDQDELIWPAPTVVSPTRLPMFGKLLAPAWKETTAAEQVVANSQLVSCHAFWRWHNQWMHKMHKRYGVPYWFVPHGGLDPWVLSQGAAAKRAFLQLGGMAFLRDAGAIVCSTFRELAKIRSLVGDCQGAVIPWPLADSDFRERDEVQRAQVRTELDIPAGAFAVLCFGRLHPMKGPLEVIKTIAQIADSNVHLIVLGNEYGITHQQCRDLARHLGVGSQVHVVGAVYGAARHRYLDAADLYISLSRRENFNFTAAEALAAGLPVVLSAGNDLGPMLRDAGCGWILESDELSEASRVVRDSSQLDSQQLRVMGEAGAAWVRAHCSRQEFDARVRLLARLVTGQSRDTPSWINPDGLAA